VIALVAFAVMFGSDIVRVWSAPAGRPPADNQAFLYIATAIAALVGGFVALSFGIKPKSSAAVVQGSLLRRNVHSLGKLLMLSPGEVIGSAYLVIYLAIAVAACATWAYHPDETTPLVKNLALTFVGLIIPIVSAYLEQ
jgi:tryptophan-rich sensory protein